MLGDQLLVAHSDPADVGLGTGVLRGEGNWLTRPEVFSCAGDHLTSHGVEQRFVYRPALGARRRRTDRIDGHRRASRQAHPRRAAVGHGAPTRQVGHRYVWRSRLWYSSSPRQGAGFFTVVSLTGRPSPAALTGAPVGAGEDVCASRCCSPSPAARRLSSGPRPAGSPARRRHRTPQQGRGCPYLHAEAVRLPALARSVPSSACGPPGRAPARNDRPPPGLPRKDHDPSGFKPSRHGATVPARGAVEPRNAHLSLYKHRLLGHLSSYLRGAGR